MLRLRMPNELAVKERTIVTGLRMSVKRAAAAASLLRIEGPHWAVLNDR